MYYKSQRAFSLFHIKTTNDRRKKKTLTITRSDLTVFRPSSFHIMLQTSFGLQMQVQLVPLMQLYITLDQSFQNKTCGLCGNFNLVLSDELKTPQGLVEGTAASFGNSWKAQYHCPDRSERLDDPCSYNIDSESYAEHWCSKLKEKEGPFARCHSAINPESYYKRCKYSSCTCERSENCLCAVFSSYVRACTAKGIFLKGWRDTVCEKYTQHCPASQTFSYLLRGCQRTCDSLNSERQACSTDFVPVDGCACPDGLYENEEGICVSMDKCSCYYNGEHIKPGKSVNIRNEHCVCTNGKLSCHSWRTVTTECPAPKVFFNCSEAGPSEYGLECARTCANMENTCYSAGCVSGCQCPSDLLDDGHGNCVKKQDCPCKHNGHVYAVGSVIKVDCNKCTCLEGNWHCSDKKCFGTCITYGSGHYHTFDKKTFGFSGDCSYIAVQDKCGNKTEGTFHVITENMPCGTTGTTCTKDVRIVLGNTQLDLVDGKVTETNLRTGPKIRYTKERLGNFLVIEAKNGLKVMWDHKTTVRIVLEPEHMGEVCGLCGNFNGNGKDDFTTQGQLQVSDVVEFINSWKVYSDCPDSKPEFDPCLTTPNRHNWAKMQCGIITGDTFKDCHLMVDPKFYYDNCVKDACACDTGGDCECFCTAVAAYAQACNDAGVCVAWRTPEICPVFCEYYNDPEECTWHYFGCDKPCYKTCLKPNDNCTDLPNMEGEVIFKMLHIGSGICLTMICSDTCEIKNLTQLCPTTTTTISTPSTSTPTPTTPSYDCPTWDANTNETFEICNCTMARCIKNNVIEIIPFECPPLRDVTCLNKKNPVKGFDEYHCCEQNVCDCFCEGWGDPHYITFDGLFYSHQGNCTYVLMEEIKPKHNLKIYIDNVNCDPRESVSCPRALIVSYNNQVITLKNNNLIGTAQLQALKGNDVLKLPFTHNGVKLLGSGLNMILEIPQLGVVVTFGVTGFSVFLPFEHFGKNTQGHCGMGILFKECHPHISPDNYFKGCQFDSCHVSNPAVVCTSLQTYAVACAQFGICLDWRNSTKLCTIECPGDKIYKPCGPADPPTCENRPNEPSLNVTTEGCFCPDGTLLFNMDSGLCVDKCGCLDPSGQAREPGEMFQLGCQDCICDASTLSVTCKPKPCSNNNQVICNEPGFIVVNETDPSDECCSILVCRCDSTICPPTNVKCPIGFHPVLQVPEGKCCPELICEPKKVCVHKNMEYAPGTSVPVVDCQDCQCTWDVDPKTQLCKIKCTFVSCNENCEPGYDYVEPVLDECCGKCVQSKCIFNLNGTKELLQSGEEWTPSTHSCERFACVYIGGEYVTTSYKIQCPPFDINNCQPGTVQLSADGCCQVCVERERGCKVQAYEDHIYKDGCMSDNKVEQTHCEGDCNSYSKYSELGFSSCSCCQAARTSNRTVTMTCLNGDALQHSYIYVEECSCGQTKCHIGN
ncbi:hypothetical protein NFI96_021106 [Prochilodus magdalenae]|nr:hypothetical protein NFI96_021106 [Prochilodus magdalenae]